MNHIPTPDFTHILCLGVAGNFAGHLEQAGETPDFVQVQTKSATAPKGLFPYYVPNHPAQLGQNPLSSTRIKYPEELADNAHLQAEPEVCILFDVTYQNNMVTTLSPVAFSAFNDCSIRKPGAKKISEKKNWGEHTKGVAKQFIKLSGFEQDCELDTFHIASFLKRENQFYPYGNDSSVLTYSYFHQTLTNWIIEQLNTQSDFGPLENLQEHIKTAGYPKQMMISLGATTYTLFGETTFLQTGDELFFYVYDATKNSPESALNHAKGKQNTLNNSSILHQTIV
jgi:hypothetical protein